MDEIRECMDCGRREPDVRFAVNITGCVSPFCLDCARRRAGWLKTEGSRRAPWSSTMARRGKIRSDILEGTEPTVPLSDARRKELLRRVLLEPRMG